MLIISFYLELVEDLIRCKRGFEIFLIDLYAGNIAKMVLQVLNKKYLYQCHPPIPIGSVHTGCIYDICIIYLNVIEACLKLLLLFFIFAMQKTLQILWKTFLISSLYILKKNSSSTNIRKKSLLLWRHKNGKFFAQKFVIFNVIIDSFLVKKWGTLEVARR